MNKIIKNALILAAITLIAGLLLGAAHQVTLEPIQKQQEKEKQESCQNVFPEAASFEEVTMSDAEKAELTAALIGHGFEAQTIDELLLAKDASGATIGLVEIISTTEGYGGGMQFSMGIASDGTTKGISFLSLSETAGLGMRADTDDFKNQFKDKNVEAFSYTKSGASADDEIDALSGATLTTNAVTNGVNAGICCFNYCNESGIIKENPTLVMMLGMCPTLAVTTSAKNGIGMGLATMVILTASNLMISLLRKIIPDGVRMPAYIVVVASFVTIVEFLMEGFIPALYSALGIYIPLIVVNCIILGRAEAYAGKHGPIPSLFDGIGMGLGFTVGLTLIGMFRELIGAGTLFGIQVMPSAYEPVNIFIMAPGAFLVLAMLVAVQNRIKRQKSEKTGKPAVPAEETGCMACANKAYCQAVKGKEEAK